MMKAGEQCRKIIRHFESFRANPYICPSGYPTIGYGTRWYENGKAVRLSDPKITKEDAEELMTNDLLKFETAVNAELKVSVNQSQFDALVSFCYNSGRANFRASKLLKYLNGGGLSKPDWKREVTKHFAAWRLGTVLVNGRKVKKVMPGLVRRRATEALLFCDGDVKFFQ